MYSAWAAANPGATEPRDPFDGERYGYHAEDGESVIWSIGLDVEDSDDDIYYFSNAAAQATN